MSFNKFNGFNAINGLVALGNRSDSCYLCEKDIYDKEISPDERFKEINALKGHLEGEKVVKIKRNGTETAMCLKCIHKIAEENPIEEEKEDAEA